MEDGENVIYDRFVTGLGKCPHKKSLGGAGILCYYTVAINGPIFYDI